MNNEDGNRLATGPGLSRRAVLTGSAAVFAAIGTGALGPRAAYAAQRLPAAAAAASAAVTGASASVAANGTYTITTTTSPTPAGWSPPTTRTT
ncbi:MAG TPA: hypothetical protein VHZ33_01400 [Trebonia sp.]|jgi:hypothetical protein|nr:hypothetical protein [Trebonia sp.]